MKRDREKIDVNECSENWSVHVSLLKIICVKFYHMSFDDFFYMKIDNVMSKLLSWTHSSKFKLGELTIVCMNFCGPYHRQ